MDVREEQEFEEDFSNFLQMIFGEHETDPELNAAYDHFDSLASGIDRELTKEECEDFAQQTASQFNLDWKWESGKGLVFSKKAN